MIILLGIAALGVLGVGMFSITMLLLTLFAGIQLLATRKNNSDYDNRKKNFKNCGIVFLISLAAIAGFLGLMALIGSQVTFSM